MVCPKCGIPFNAGFIACSHKGGCSMNEHEGQDLSQPSPLKTVESYASGDTAPPQQEGQDTDSSLQKTIAFTIALSSIITADTFKANKLADEIVEALNQSPKPDSVNISRDTLDSLKHCAADTGYPCYEAEIAEAESALAKQ